MGLNGIVPAGVVTGDNLIKLMDYCKKNGHALPGKRLHHHNHVIQTTLSQSIMRIRCSLKSPLLD